MCLFSQLVRNPKYKPNKKNGGQPPFPLDPRTLKVPIACGKCIECRNQEARKWLIRLTEDIKENTTRKFVTMTFSEESMTKLSLDINEKLTGYDIDNAIATKAIRYFTERYRQRAAQHNKKHKNNQLPKTLRHWLVTELGQESTERLHIHGIIWTTLPKKEILSLWQYGNMGYEMTWQEERNVVNGATINYITKYVSKIDEKHKEYKPKILTSNGIGAAYIKSAYAKQNIYRGEETRDYYRTENGYKIQLPIYYRNKIYSDTDREKLWIQKLDTETRYINGTKIDISKENGLQIYMDALHEEQKRNSALGYGDNSKNWEREKYENDLRTQKNKERLSALWGMEEAPQGGERTDLRSGVNSRIPYGLYAQYGDRNGTEGLQYNYSKNRSSTGEYKSTGNGLSYRISNSTIDQELKEYRNNWKKIKKITNKNWWYGELYIPSQYITIKNIDI